MQNTTQASQPSSNFIKSLIKIANPDWTPEQIEAEALRKMTETADPNNDSCEFCSS
jgi:hypothetical protein